MDDMVSTRKKRVETFKKEREISGVLERKEDLEERPHHRETISPLGLSARPQREPLISSRQNRSLGGGRFPKKTLAVLSGLILVGLLITFFTSVRVTIIPEKEERVVASLLTLTTYKTTASSTLSFTEYSSGGESASEEVSVSGTESVSKKASGEIVILNSYSASPVRLIANTRFLAPNGNIYRITDAVNVPGMRKEGGTTTPGTLTVRVYADQPGPNYNLKLTDFTIPGFKGEAQFEKVIARSKTEMTGGEEGLVPVLREEEAAAARERLKKTVTERLSRKKTSELPQGFVVIPSASEIIWTEKVGAVGTNNKVALLVTGELQGKLVEEEDLLRSLFGEDATRFTIESLDGATFLTEDGGTADRLRVNVTGKLSLVAKVPTDELKTKILGKKKGELSALFGAYSGIAEARVNFFPFWARRVPDNQARVTVTITTLP